MSPNKEPDFFSDYRNDLSIKELQEYEKLFNEVKSEKIIGEASPNYIFSPNAPKKIFEYNPKAKIISIVRDSNEAIVSYFKLIAIEKRLHPQIDWDNIAPHWEIYDYKTNLARWRKIFPRKQILLLDFKEFSEDTKKVYKKVLDFLGVNDDGRIDFKIYQESYIPQSKKIELIHHWVASHERIKSFLKIFLPKSIYLKIIKFNKQSDKTNLKR